MDQQMIKALINIQSNIGIIPKTKTGQTGNRAFKYADLQSVWVRLQPLLKENRIFFTQQIKTINEKPFLISKAYHESGEFMESEIEISHVTSDIKNFGALISYYRRYATVCFFGLVCDEMEMETEEGKKINIEIKKKVVKKPIEKPVEETQKQPFKSKISTQEINKFLIEKDLLKDSKSEKRKFLDEILETNTNRSETDIIEGIYCNYNKFDEMFKKWNESKRKKASV